MALPEAFQILQTNWAEECDLGHRAKCWRRAGGTGCPDRSARITERAADVAADRDTKTHDAARAVDLGNELGFRLALMRGDAADRLPRQPDRG